MAQVTALKPTGTPGVSYTFLAKTEQHVLAVPALILEPIFSRLLAKKHKFTPVDEATLSELASPSNQVFFVSYTTKNPPPFGGRQVVSGQWLANTVQTTASFFITTFRRYYIPIQVPYDLVIDQLSVYIKVRADDKTVKLGVLSFERGKVNEVIQQNILTPNTIGIRITQMISALSAGTYCFGIMSNGSIAVRTAGHTLIGSHGSENTVTSPGYYFDDISSLDYSDGFTDDPVVTIAPLASSVAAPAIMGRVQ